MTRRTKAADRSSGGAAGLGGAADRSSGGAAGSGSSTPSLPGREELLDEAEHLRDSLEDLDREWADGNLDAADYEALRGRYEERAEIVQARLDDLVAVRRAGQSEVGNGLSGAGAGLPAASARPSAAATGPVGVESRRAGSHAGTRAFLATRRHRMVLGLSAAGCFGAAGLLIGLALAGVAPFAGTAQPPLALATRIRIELGEASVLASNKDLIQAVAVYDRVLALDPGQPEALANGGWLVRLAGLSSKRSRVVSGGDAEIAAAVKVAPGYALARAYDAVALYEDAHSARAAVAQFRAMLADRPSATLLGSVRAVAMAAYQSAGDVLPAALTPPKGSAHT